MHYCTLHCTHYSKFWSALSTQCTAGCRRATQQLMMGEYRRRLVRRHKLMCTAADRVAGSSHGNSAGAAAKRKAPSTGGVVKKGPVSVLASISNFNSEK